MSQQQANVSKRIQALEELRENWFQKYRLELRQLANQHGIMGGSLFQDALQGHSTLTGTPYVKDKYEAPGGNEFVRVPETVERRGGDCEDLNIFLLGGMLASLHGTTGLASIYLPNATNPRHVVLGVHDGAGWYGFDLVPPGSFGLFDGRGAVFTWVE